MQYRIGIAVIALLLATGVAGSSPGRDRTPMPQVTPEANPVFQKAAPEPSTADLRVGESAPMFSYLSIDGRWHGFGELVENRPVLLIFGAQEGEIEGLQDVRTIFDDMGISVAIALDMRAGSAATYSKRMKLDGPIISDPKRAIAGLYHSLDQRSLRHAPAYFVVDTKRTIRAMGYGSMPSPPQLIAITARGLGLPLPQAAWHLSDASPPPELPNSQH